MTNKEAIEQLVSLQLHCKSFMEHKHHDPWESDMRGGVQHDNRPR